MVTISPPDEALLKAVLVKHFADRQLAVEPHVVNYIALHMEQSMEAAAAIVADIDRARAGRPSQGDAGAGGGGAGSGPP